jgi:hypothetical protein
MYYSGPNNPDAQSGINWQIWKTDGTAAGTTKLTSFAYSQNYVPNVVVPHQLNFLHGSLYVAASDLNTGTELWKINPRG